jgi:hypothetical protein
MGDEGLGLSAAMRRVLSTALLVLAVLPLFSQLAAAASKEAPLLRVRFLGPVDDGTRWRVEAYVGGLTCSGVVAANPGYLQARALSRDLLVLPLYYVLSSVCDSLRLVDAVDALGRAGSVRVVIEAPGGYVARSAMDWRGYGSPGGPYVVPGGLLRRFYLYDGVVVASRAAYNVVDDGEAGASFVVYRGFRGAPLPLLRAAVLAARAEGGRVFGSSPRSPVVAVLAAPRGFPLLAPGTAYSLGGVFLVVDSLAGRSPGWYVHVFAHESLHGWVNDGLVYGDFSFKEAVVELLAVRGLLEYNRSLYRLAARYAGEGVDSGEPYAVWMRAHALLWRLTRQLCGDDAYSQALHEIFAESINLSTPRVYSLIDVLRIVREKCGPRPLEAWGARLPDAEHLSLDELLVGTSTVLSPRPAPGEGTGASTATGGQPRHSAASSAASAASPAAGSGAGLPGTGSAASATRVGPPGGRPVDARSPGAAPGLWAAAAALVLAAAAVVVARR